MDIIDVLIENIEAQDSISVQKILQHHQKTKKRKDNVTVWVRLVTSFCKKYVSTHNLWMVREFVQSIRDDNLSYACHLLLAEGPCEYERVVVKPDGNVIDVLRNNFHKEYRNVVDVWRDGLHFEPYCLMNLLYEKLLYGAIKDKADVTDCFRLMNYFMTITPRTKLYVEKGNEDAYDLLWRCILLYVSQHTLPEDVVEFVTLSKDLFYYNVKVKERRERVGILFAVFYVCLYRRVRFQVLDVRVDTPTLDLSGGKYLFVWTPVDDVLYHEVTYDREMVRQRPGKRKEVVISSSMTSSAPNINVVRHIT